MSLSFKDHGFFAAVAVSFVAMLSFILTLFWLLKSGLDMSGATRDVLLVLVGVLAGAYKDVVGFWLGSSLGAKTSAPPP